VNFEQYLLSKKIDAKSFELAEKSLFDSWKSEFEKMHPNSFTVQKLNLINPIRRKYKLHSDSTPAEPQPKSPAEGTAPKAARPVMKPKPKIN
jgi:hypothetical protein